MFSFFDKVFLNFLAPIIVWLQRETGKSNFQIARTVLYSIILIVYLKFILPLVPCIISQLEWGSHFFGPVLIIAATVFYLWHLAFSINTIFYTCGEEEAKKGKKNLKIEWRKARSIKLLIGTSLLVAFFLLRLDGMILLSWISLCLSAFVFFIYLIAAIKSCEMVAEEKKMEIWEKTKRIFI